MKPAFSTVALPDWTLARIAQRLEAWGYLGCELRTAGTGPTTFACDPSQTGAAKVREMFDRAGVSICSLGTTARFDRPVTPPVIGHVLGSTEHGVPHARTCVDLALSFECPFVRVFAFELPEGESISRGSARVAERLQRAADYCRNSGVRLLLENGGSFSRASDIAGLIDRVDDSIVQAAYCPAVAAAAGEDPEAGLRVLGGRLQSVKLRDMARVKGVGVPVALGKGELPCESVVRTLARMGYRGWIVHEFDRAWLPAGATVDVDGVLTDSSATLFDWVARATREASPGGSKLDLPRGVMRA